MRYSGGSTLDHAIRCAAVTGSRRLQVDYACNQVQDRSALVDGEGWAVRDNGYPAWLRCGW